MCAFFSHSYFVSCFWSSFVPVSLCNQVVKVYTDTQTYKKNQPNEKQTRAQPTNTTHKVWLHGKLNWLKSVCLKCCYKVHQITCSWWFLPTDACPSLDSVHFGGTETQKVNAGALCATARELQESECRSQIRNRISASTSILIDANNSMFE